MKCVPHVQHDYFSSLNQSDHCFLVSSLALPSSLRKLPSNASVNSNCALPPSPPGNCRAFARLVSPGGGALANLARPRDRAVDNPEKFVDVFKGMFP